MSTETRLIRLPAVCELTGLSRSSVYALSKTEGFPKAVKLTERSSAWSESAVRAWIAGRIAAAAGGELCRKVAA
jgi:prophage regulatory protein